MRWLAWLFILTVVLASCTAGPPTSDSIAKLKASCNSACGSESSTEITLYPISELYTTEEAVCIKRIQDGKPKLYCGTCICDSETGSYGLAPSQVLRVETETTITCKFSDSGKNLTIEC